MEGRENYHGKDFEGRAGQYHKGRGEACEGRAMLSARRVNQITCSLSTNNDVGQV